MEQFRDNLLAGTVLSGDEDVSIGGPDLADQFEDRLHRWCACNKVRHAFGTQQTVFKLELAGAPQRLVQFGVDPDKRNETFVLPGLLDKVTGAAFNALHGQIDVAPSCHHDHRQTRIDLQQASKQIKTLLAGGRVARVVQVNEQNIVIALAEGLEQQLRRSDAVGVNALRLK